MDNRPTPKRSISNLIAGMRESRTTMESIEEPVALTAPQVAVEHFTKELLAHSQPGVEAETAVIIHDACYGHRFSRQKTPKSHLSMIVERPERIHASILGASAAYVRMGGQYEGARNAPQTEKYSSEPPPFKIRRTQRSIDITSLCVTNVHGTAWMNELGGMCGLAGGKLAVGEKEVSRIVGPGEMESEKRMLHEGDLYLSPESLNAFQGALGGVADAVDTVFDLGPTKRTFVAVRPPGHHCSADHPSGFCWLNNVHFGIEYAAQTHGLTHAAILDFDLHHGDGSQAITWERNSENNMKRLGARPNQKLKLNPDIGYYSLHDINSYPCEMGDDEKVQAASLCIENSHGQNVWNVHLQPFKTEEEFWELYETRYKVLIEKARTFLRQQTQRINKEGKIVPKAAVFISAGFDASEWEGSGMQRHKVNVPTEFYARFTRDLVALAEEEGMSCDGRVISVLEGGYSDRALCSGALSHISGLCASPAVEAAPAPGNAEDSLALSMAGLSMDRNKRHSRLRYDKAWWSPDNLTALENKVNPPPPPQAKKVRTGAQPTYATPTESFAYKVRDTEQFARSISGTMREVPRPVRPVTPPPAEVNWVVATQELSKLLIPTDRQTKSFTAEELAPVRTKKERQSAMPALSSEDMIKPMKLRDRGKARAPPPPSVPESAYSDDLESMRSVSRSSRRITIADFPSAGETAAAPPQQQQKQMPRASRRSSINSNISPLPDGGLNGSAVGSSVPPVPTTTNTIAGRGAMKPPPLPANLSATTAGAQAKKSRAPAKPRGSGPERSTTSTQSTKPTATAAAPPARPPLPTTQTAPLPTTNPTNSTSDKNHMLSRSSTHTPTEIPSDPLDSLSKGLKRISIKVPPREEHDRRQAERLARERAERSARAVRGAETRKANREARKVGAGERGGSGGGVKKEGFGGQTGGKSIQQSGVSIGGTKEASGDVEITHGDSAVANPELPAFEQPIQSEAQGPPIGAQHPTTPPASPSPALQYQLTTAPYPPSNTNPPQLPTASTNTASTPAPTRSRIPDTAALQLRSENNTAPNPVVANNNNNNNLFVNSTATSPSRVQGHAYGGGSTQLPAWSATGRIPFAASSRAVGASSAGSGEAFAENVDESSGNGSDCSHAERPISMRQVSGVGNGVSRSVFQEPGPRQ